MVIRHPQQGLASVSIYRQKELGNRINVFLPPGTVIDVRRHHAPWGDL
jgi:hypothetical protein